MKTEKTNIVVDSKKLVNIQGKVSEATQGPGNYCYEVSKPRIDNRAK